MTWQLRVGAVQMCSSDDLRANLATCRRLIEQAVTEGAQLVALPECFSFLGRKEGDKLPIAETFESGSASRATGNMGTTTGSASGPILGLLRELAAKHGVHILGGGTPEIVVDDPTRTYNTAVLVGP